MAGGEEHWSCRWQACDLNSQFKSRNLHRTLFSPLRLGAKCEKFDKVDKTRASPMLCFWGTGGTTRLRWNYVSQICPRAGAFTHDSPSVTLWIRLCCWHKVHESRSRSSFWCPHCKMYSAAALLRSAVLRARERRKWSHITHLQPELSLWGSATGGWVLWNQNSS